MFNLTAMAAAGDAKLSARYAESVSLAVGLCESLPDQFKLIETPINSFLLVANVMPNDNRPWDSRVPSPGGDFHNIRMPRLERLEALIRCRGAYNREVVEEATVAGEAELLAGEEVVAGERGSRGGLEKQAKGGRWPPEDGVAENGTELKNGREEAAPGESLHYAVYDSWCWQRALKINKDEMVREAIAELAKPQNWRGVALEDPLPLMWLLFYGKRSFCDGPECLYEARFGHPGPLLLPNSMYRPGEDAVSFASGLCRYVRFLYGCEFRGGEHVNLDQVPFDAGRFPEALRKLRHVDDAGTYVSRRCLACRLYAQNLMSRGLIGGRGASIILGGWGKKYITCDAGTRRCLSLGDVVLYPCYDISLILDDLAVADGNR
ncbi:protein UL95 [Equid gammaherpesvirus 5]|uniref:Protein UL95 n=1 Tax=Equid gammaherpesvirus 5 TaxID=10371 RepID=A0A0B4Q6B2_9GAMA|nr:protein UL95 [Equid gammaherpesvirus 5]AIU39559.1 protein UL95 [Equid gammaherpesvirus 5]APT43395.1 protein UL95 [Equid gammaherpesvirus 5]